ncbi:Probable ATP-dependent RNA helicase DDX46 [Eumeta japonica]|uniref:Probable ATP-dependent RNA helicase DDX46 n=1 Tax=Eumeta variegata TaxID=151549 RepID=A0A4C1UX18_EUMVA|nr:Probable ATP-dependent RNA helicase DDX46 [Eumeta japonica]
MVRSGRDRDRDRDRRRSHSRSVSPDRKRRRSRSRSRDRSSKSSKRKRSRSRERDSKRDRSRDRDRDRDRKSDKRDDKKSSSKSSRKRSPDKERASSKEKKNDNSEYDLGSADKEEEQSRLEAEMQKRRDRIERWRAERKRKELESAKKEVQKGSIVNNIQPSAVKKWSLEDDSGDEGEEGDNKEKPVVEDKKEEEDEIDPLDAYMQGVQEEVRKVNQMDQARGIISGPATGTGVVILTGELIEQNQDGLEYSSEEEVEDIKDAAANLASKQRKDLAKVDHASLNYMPFRKAFYTEVGELARMTPEEVELYRQELEGIRVKGKGCPKPIKTWAHCGMSKKELDILKKLGFEKPTPIQAQAIPAIMCGRDLIGIAKTGSGKTLAFILPMFRHVLDQPPLEETDGPISLIMTPTRELCMQIGKDIKKFAKSLGLRVVCVYGGTGISEQIAELKRGAEMIVCTPGRMIDMLAANSGRVTNLRRVTYVVLDEADRMFDMGFEPQVMKIIDNIRPDRQTVMFSATFPRQMEALARRILHKPIEVQVGGRSVVCKDVEQHVAILEEEDKFFKLLELLGLYSHLGSIIVFVDKQENADSLLKDLMKASYSCMSLHGGIDQFDRDSTIVDFKSGKVRLLVATSVAARGLDVRQLVLVVNYDCPNHYEDYVHRCGRTGRAGNKGFAWTFLTPEQGRYAGDVVRAFELAGATAPLELKQLWEKYKEKQEQEGKKVHTGGGFSGKGFKFDESEALAVNEKKKYQKAALGLQDSDDEDVEGDLDQQIETMLAAKKIVKEIKPGMSGMPVVPNAAATTATSGPSIDGKLELARRLASRINLAKGLGEQKGATQQAAEAILKGAPSAHTLITAKTVAEQLAAKLNTRLNYQPRDESADQPEEMFRKYETELEINDFPQQARWREALALISEYSEAGITVRGTYVPPGKNPPEGERKLYLAIESSQELAVAKAKSEITRLIKEELLKAQTTHQFINKARYKAWATSATADGLAPEGASQTKKFCLQVIKKRPRKKFCLQVIKKRPRKPDVADVHEWCSAATVYLSPMTNSSWDLSRSLND